MKVVEVIIYPQAFNATNETRLAMDHADEKLRVYIIDNTLANGKDEKVYKDTQIAAAFRFLMNEALTVIEDYREGE